MESTDVQHIPYHISRKQLLDGLRPLLALLDVNPDNVFAERFEIKGDYLTFTVAGPVETSATSRVVDVGDHPASRERGVEVHIRIA